MVYQKNTFEDGAKYERMMGVWSQLVGTHFLEWLNPTVGLNWIDIGCGSGAFTAQVAEFFSPSHLLGIDPSEAQIEFARNRSIKHPVTFQTGDAMSLQCVDNSMDIATMALVLFFVPDPEKTLAEMKRVVKPGGIIAAYVWDIFGGGMPLAPLHRELQKRKIEYQLPPKAEVSKKDELKRLWNDTDLKLIECKQISVTRQFENFEEFWNITSSSHSMSLVFKKLTPQLISDIRLSVEKEFNQNSSEPLKIQAHVNAIKGFV